MRQALAVLSEAGLSVSIKNDGKTLSVIPSRKLTNNLRKFIVTHKSDILAELQTIPPRASGVIRYQLRNGSAGTVIDSEGLQSAINTLIQHYGPNLDVAALVDTLLLMGEAAKVEAATLMQRMIKR
jgi:hypothetical protein